jgi:hypothetical protein
MQAVFDGIDEDTRGKVHGIDQSKLVTLHTF